MEIVKKWYGTWITPDKGLPVESARVLIEYESQMNSATYDLIVSGFYTELPVSMFVSDRGCYIDPQNVVAWMALPEPMRKDTLTEKERATLLRATVDQIERRLKEEQQE